MTIVAKFAIISSEIKKPDTRFARNLASEEGDEKFSVLAYFYLSIYYDVQNPQKVYYFF